MTAPALDRVDLAELTGAFGQLLHAAGVPVSPERSGRFATAVSLVRPADLDEWYWAGRVTLLSGRDDIETYDRVFGQVFRGLADAADWRGQSPPPPPARRPAAAAPRGAAVADDAAGSGDREPRPGAAGADPTSPAPAGGEGDAGDGTPDVLAAASAEERLRRTDFAQLTDDELAALGDLMAALRPAAPGGPAAARGPTPGAAASTCGRRSARPGPPAATPPGAGSAAGPSAPATWSSSPTSPGRWRPTPGRTSTCSMARCGPPGPTCSCSPPGSPA